MSDQSISIVPKTSSYPEKTIKAKEILDWLVSLDIVKPTLSECTLSSNNGYAISEGAKHITEFPQYLPFDLKINGLEISTERQIFHAGENGIEECICPNCDQDISSEDWSFLDEWAEQRSNNLTCPLCNVPTDIHAFRITPEWGFSDLGFTFWNWPVFKDEFISAFKQKLGIDISIVLAKI